MGMNENINVMLSNYEKAEVLEDKASNLNTEARKFHTTARKTKRTMCMRNLKMNLIIALIVILVLVIVLVPIIVKFVPSKDDRRLEEHLYSKLSREVLVSWLRNALQ